MEKVLLDSAEKAMETAYAPYSHFYVGCAILAQNGEIITGSNVENASYGLVICAERVAIVRANVLGIRLFEKFAVIARGETYECKEPTTPCGSCRQFIYEFANGARKNFEILCSTTKKDKIVIKTIKDLIPDSFGPADFGVDLAKYFK